MTSVNIINIPVGEARSVEIDTGERFRIVNTFGGQVVDTWVFSKVSPFEHLSMEHSRSANYRLWFQIGDTLMSNHFKPIVSITADTSPGIHDTLHAACSAGSYAFYQGDSTHPNCQENLLEQMSARGVELSTVPCPWNLFEHAMVDQKMTLTDQPSAAMPGDYIELKAEQDLVVVCSACPSTVGKISGDKPRGAAIHLTI